ncbi:MAG: flagellar M-ring protein FliF [Pseudomonadota bacterium]|jgi:flagellar M-ring protein FliF
MTEPPVQNLADIWNRLDTRRRIILAGATVAVFLAVLALARLAATPQTALLYAGLDTAAAGNVVAALDARGVTYEVRGDAIHVDAARRDSLRMELAAEGLPATSAKGYELLDSMTGFGTTAQMFDAAQWRAVEGELARTILASQGVSAARVHIARAASRGLAAPDGLTASVAVTPAAGRIGDAQAQAIRHLVAAAVAGLSPDAVQVVDTVHGLVGGEDTAPAAQAASRADDIRRNVERLLAARVGQGKAVVEVAVELVSESEEISERRIDPESRTAISTETEAQSGNSTEPGGPATVASNLPEGDAAAGQSTSTTEESRERVNYELSETRRELRRQPGDIRRLTVAVLVDSAEQVAEDGTITRTPREEAELATLRELVAAAAGINAERGDVLTLHSMEFRPETANGTLAEASLLTGSVDIGRIVQMAVAGLIALALALFVIRPLLAPRATPALALPASDAPATAILDEEVVLPPLALVGDGTDPPEDPVARLRRLIAERQAESVEILRGWMEAEGSRR